MLMDKDIRTSFARRCAAGAKRTGAVLAFSLLALLAAVYPLRSAAQTDTAFWFVAPDLNQLHADRPIYLRVSTFGSPAVITISQPANASFPVQTVSIGAYATRSVDLTAWIDAVENTPSNTVNNKGIFIRSSAPIAVYYDVANAHNGDMFALKGRNALGQQFRVPFQNAWTNRFPSSSIEIVATEDATSVTVTPAADIVGHPAGEPFTITLQRGQTFSCEATGYTGAAHLPGTLITSNKPIAVTTRDDSLVPDGTGCWDTAGDQLVPDRLAGHDFIVVKGFLDGADNVYVLATEDGCAVTIDGTEVAVLKAGESYRYLLTNPTASIHTGKPAHVFHITGFGCEIGGAVIPTIQCTGSQELSITRAGNQYFGLNILAPTAAVDYFTLNGQPGIITGAQFSVVPGTGGKWSYARISVSTAALPAGAVGNIKNSRGRFQLGLIQGDQSTTCRYGYFSDFAKNDIILSYTSGPYCVGSGLTVEASNSSGTNQFSWTGPNGFTATTPSITLTGLDRTASGYYVARTAGACGAGVDSILVQVREKKEQAVDALICAGQSYRLPSGRLVQVSGTYNDTVRYTGGCDSLISVVALTVKAVETQGQGVTICAGESYTTVWGARLAAAGVYSDTLRYSTSGCDSLIRTVRLGVIVPKVITHADSICSNQWYTLPWGPKVNTTGVYRDTVRSVGGCDSVITIADLRVDPAPVVRVMKSNDIDCRFESVQLEARGGLAYSWSPALALSNASIPNPVATPVATTLYTVQVTGANGCRSEGQVEVAVTGGDPQRGYRVPNAFTPNSDGHNDCFGVPHWAGVKAFSLTVFNRWGEVVFRSANVGQCWDGMYKGQRQVPGVYAYLITANTDCGKVTRRGTVALLR